MTLTTEQRSILRYLADKGGSAVTKYRTVREVWLGSDLLRWTPEKAYRQLRRLKKAGLVEQTAGFLWSITLEGRGAVQ